MTDPRWEANQEVSRAASGSANELVPALASIIRSGDWREFVHPMRGTLRFERFADYCNDFLGLTPKAVEALLDRSNFQRWAGEVRELIREGIEPVGDNGGARVKGQSRNTRVTDSDTINRVVATLKKRDPDLAARVVAGEITPHAAALQAGIRKPRISVRADDVHLAVAALLRHYTADEIVRVATGAAQTHESAPGEKGASGDHMGLAIYGQGSADDLRHQHDELEVQ